METSIKDPPAELAPISVVNRLQTRAKGLLDSIASGMALTGSIDARAKAALIVVALGLLLYRISAFERDYLYGMLVDDAYISARHAKILVEGHGLNFNADERIEGYTNFLFTILMAVPQFFGWAVEPFMRALGSVTAVAVLWLTCQLAISSVGPFVATVLAAALLLDQRFVFFSIWGLETVFACLPCLLGYLLLFRARPAAAGCAFAAAAMTRIDMIVLIVPAFLYALFPTAERTSASRPTSAPVPHAAGSSGPWLDVMRVAGPFTAIFGGYFATRWYYYGWLLPNTFYAKVGEPGDSWRRGWAYVLECFSKMGISTWVLVAVPAWIACFGFLLLRHKPHPRSWPEGFRQAVVFLAGASGYLAYVIAVGGDHFKERFIYHAFPVILLACVAPLRWVFELALPLQSTLRRFVWVPSVALALLMAGALAMNPHRFNRAGGVAAWVSLGQYLKSVARPGAVLATDAAGAIPYYSGLKTIDILGLADIHTGHMAVEHLGSGPAGHEKLDRAYVLGRNPDYISTWLGSDGTAARGFGRDQEFNRQYRLAALVRTDSSEVTTERVLTVGDPEPPRTELVKLREGKGHVPGRYDWALYERRTPGVYAPVSRTGFRSNLPGWERSDQHIVSAKRGHAPIHIMWGPFIQLQPGRYDGYVKMNIGELDGLDPRQRLCGFDVYDGKRSRAAQSLVTGLSAPGARNLYFAFDVEPTEQNAKFEFRMYCSGLADITIDSVFISAGSRS